MIAAAADGTPRPGVDDIKGERHVRLQHGVEASRRRPGAEAHTRNSLPLACGLVEGKPVAVARHRVAVHARAHDGDLGALEGGIDGPRGSTLPALLTEHEPGFERLAQLERYALVRGRAPHGKAELEVRLEPPRSELQSSASQFGHDAVEI